MEILFSLGLVALAYGIVVFLLWRMNNEQPTKRKVPIKRHKP